jgi:hypothetical protein
VETGFPSRETLLSLCQAGTEISADAQRSKSPPKSCLRPSYLQIGTARLTKCSTKSLGPFPSEFGKITNDQAGGAESHLQRPGSPLQNSRPSRPSAKRSQSPARLFATGELQRPQTQLHNVARSFQFHTITTSLLYSYQPCDSSCGCS